MADCDDRQLSEAQRQAGYQNQRTGVQQAVRPFSGRPTLDNLIDYINRELFPAVKATRNKVNDVYLQTTDNAPSGNPLQYYFSTETAAADPTAGRVRLNASPQDTATTLRVSEQNARLVDARPWLEVMAGGATTPLGVVTLSDAVNPARFIRFDLNSMTDQGVYWDLSVTVIESSHDDPFVDGGGLVISFIPGVASTGTTVPAGALTPIGPNTVLGNPTASTAAPTEIAIDDLSVLGRAGLAGTGNLEDITVPGTGTFTGESVFLRSPSVRTSLQFRNFTLGDLPLISDNRFVGNVTGATARPAYTDLAQLAQDLFGIGWDAATHNFRLSDVLDNTFMGNTSGATTYPQPTPLSDLDSISITYENVGKSFVREALTGDVTALQNNNTVTVNANAITNAKLDDMAANTVKANATASTADPTDFPVGTNSVLGRVAGNIVAAQVVTAQIADAAVTNAKLRDSAGISVIGRATTTTGVPADIVATFGTGVVLRESGSTIGWGTVATAGIANNAITNAKLAQMAQSRVKGRAEGAGTGDPTDLTPTEVVSIIDGENATWTGAHSFTGASHTVNVSGAANTTAGATSTIQTSAGNLIQASAVDYLLTAQADVVINAGDTAGGVAIHAGLTPKTAANDNRVTITADDQVVLEPTGSCRIFTGGVERVEYESTGAWQISGAVGTTGHTIVTAGAGAPPAWGQLPTAGIADDAVTNAKLRNSGALSVIGRSANSTGDPADISAVAASGSVLRESGSTVGFGTIATAGITDAAVTNAKLADMTAGTVKGRQIDATTGVPVDLTGLEVAELIRFGTTQAVTLAATTNDQTLNADTTVMRITPTGAQTLTGITGGAQGRLLLLENIAAAGNPLTLASLDAGSLTANRLRTPGGVALVLGFRESAILRWETNNNDWRVVAVSRATAVADADYGDITVTSSGATWTIDNSAVTLAKMANLAAGTVIGRQIDASTGVPVALAGAEQGENIRFNTRQTVAASGTLDITLNDDTTILVLQLSADATLRSISNTASGDGRLLRIEHDSGSAFTLTLGHNLATPTFFPLYNSDEADMQVRRGSTVVYRSRSGFWRPEIPSSRMRVRKNSTGTVFDRGRFNLIEGTGVTLTVTDDSSNNEVDVTITGGVVSDGDKGDVTVSSTGTVWTIDNDVVTDAKLRNSGALSVIGRSANSTGDPADISGTASSDQVLRVSGTTLGFGTVATAGIANNAVTDAKIRQSAGLTVIGRAANSTGDVADIGAGVDGYVLRRIGTLLGFGPIATAGIDDDQVTNAKLRNSGALSVIGRSANSTGDPADISATAASGAVLRESGSALGFGTIATAGIADAAVTLAKQANLAQSTIIGRAESAGTGVPQALTSTQVAAIIDGEPFTWLSSHTFNGTNHTVTASADITLTAGGTLTLSATTQVQATSPTRLASSVALDGVTSTATTAANDLVIGSVSAVRFTGPVDPLTGMVAVVGGQTVLLVNAHASTNMGVHMESASSTAANRFAGVGTSRVIRPGEMALAWYDSTSSRWRLLCRDEVDL